MAGGANFSGYLGLGGTGLKGIAAEAFYGDFHIFGMNTFFHTYLLVSGNRPAYT